MTKRLKSCRGFSLVELLIALVVLTTASLTVATALIAANRHGLQTTNWLRAIVLMIDAQETVRAGHALDPQGEESHHQRRVVTTPDASDPRLRHVEITISWEDSMPHSWSLSTAMANVE